MTDETKKLIWRLFKIGTVGTIVSIPVGIWALRRWDNPKDTWKTTVLLTAYGMAWKDYLFRNIT